jgi:nucleoside-diphosphate-sugar epimerase
MRIFVAGATGATGTVFVPLAEKRHDLVLHVRPQSKDKTPLGSDPRARVFDLDDDAALRSAMRGCDAVISFVGTMKNRFAAGDTYESSDLGSTRKLVAAAVAEKVPRFLLLSSYGAGGMGAYLQMKLECEKLVRESGLAWSIFRPSVLESPKESGAGTHGRRGGVVGARYVFGAIKAIPFLRGWGDDVRPIGIDVLCRAMLAVVDDPSLDGSILAGRDLYRLSDRGR